MTESKFAPFIPLILLVAAAIIVYAHMLHDLASVKGSSRHDRMLRHQGGWLAKLAALILVLSGAIFFLDGARPLSPTRTGQIDQTKAALGSLSWACFLLALAAYNIMSKDKGREPLDDQRRSIWAARSAAGFIALLGVPLGAVALCSANSGPISVSWSAVIITTIGFGSVVYTEIRRKWLMQSKSP